VSGDVVSMVDSRETIARGQGAAAIRQMRLMDSDWEPVNDAHWDAIRRLPAQVGSSYVRIECLTPDDLAAIGLHGLGAALQYHSCPTLGAMQEAFI
jgi:hypothetical protein